MDHMLTIFTIPKPFTDPHIRLIQRNAIGSWRRLHPDIDIILMGDDAGVAEAAKEFRVRHIPGIAQNEFGTPLLNSAFTAASAAAIHEQIMYTNTDMLYVSNLIDSLRRLPEKEALTIGRRIDLDVATEIDFNESWDKALAQKARTDGMLHSWAGIDYFLFSRGMFTDLPPFAVGRVGWDNWTVAEARRTYRYTIDATACITAIHQNHAYSGNNAGASRKTNPEAALNNSFTKSPWLARTIQDANWRLTPEKLRRNPLCFIPPMKRQLGSMI